MTKLQQILAFNKIFLWKARVPYLDLVTSYLIYDKVKNTELRLISMQGHSPVPRVSDQSLISYDEVKNSELK